MRRELKTVSNNEWELLCNIPFTLDLNDVSGNGNHASLISGTPSFVDYNGEKWCDSRHSVIRLETPNQIDYVNNFKLEIDFVWFSGGSVYFALVDGCDDGNRYKGLMIGSSYGTLFSFGLRFANQSVLDGVYGYTPSKSDIMFNKTYHVEMTNYNGLCTVKLTDEDGNVQEGSSSTPEYTAVSYTFLVIGADARYQTERAFNGYFRNFKLYKHKEG